MRTNSITQTMTRRRNTRRHQHGQTRSALAVVELAILLPILLTITFGTLEICNRLFLRQSASVAAYEGARLAARRTVTTAQVEARCLALLAGRNITGGQVIVTPGAGGLATLPTGEELIVQVVIPIAGNTPVSYVFSPSGAVNASAYMLRE